MRFGNICVDKRQENKVRKKILMTMLCVFSLLGISGCKFMEKVDRSAQVSLHKHGPGNHVQGHHHRHMQRHDH